MNKESVTFINWMALLLVIPGLIAVIWKIVVELRQNKKVASNSLISVLLIFSVLLGVLSLNIHSPLWLVATLLGSQFVVFVLLFKMLWPVLSQKLRGID